MKILPERSILDNKYKTVIRPLEMGDSIRTAQQEIDMLADTPQILRYSDIEFKGSFIVSNGNPILSEDENAVVVTIDNINNKEFVIDENLEISLEIDATKVADGLLDSTMLTTKQLYAQAQIILFETKVKNRIKELLEIARSNVNDFEVVTEETL
ncbi:hypothetical protein D7V90_07470 [bacterium 1xD42-87]|nr:hypothetical protein D7V90_07470 [bacterium 1xD42-87]